MSLIVCGALAAVPIALISHVRCYVLPVTCYMYQVKYYMLQLLHDTCPMLCVMLCDV